MISAFSRLTVWRAARDDLDQVVAVTHGLTAAGVRGEPDLLKLESASALLRTPHIRILLGAVDGLSAGLAYVSRPVGGMPELRLLAVLPRWRSRGLGTRLLNQAIVVSLPFEAFTVGLVAGQPDAARWLERRGFWAPCTSSGDAPCVYEVRVDRPPRGGGCRSILAYGGLP